MKTKIKLIRKITVGELLILFILFLIMSLIGFIGVVVLSEGLFGIILTTILGVFLIINSIKTGNWVMKAIGLKTSHKFYKPK